MAAVLSPLYELDCIFYHDYLLMFSDLSASCNLCFGGNISSAPRFAQAFVPLVPSFFDSFTSLVLYNKYMHSLSNLFLPFHYLRFGFERNRNDSTAQKLAIFFSRCKPDIAYLFPLFPELYSVNIREKCNTKIVVEFWEDQVTLIYNALKNNRVSNKYAHLERDRGYAWTRSVVESADQIIVPTVTLKTRLMKLGLSDKRVSVIPVCQDRFTFRDPGYVKRKHGLTKEKLLLYLGSLTGYHDLKTLFLSLNRVRTENVALLVAGGTEAIVERFRNLIKNEKVRIVYVGRPSTSELEEYLSAADVALAIYSFVEPSGFFPGSIIKYMLAAKAIIATDLPEIREMFKGKKAGLLVRQLDEAQLAAAIDFLLEHTDEGLEMGVAAKEIATNNYLWHHHNEAVLKVFDLVS